MSRSLRFILAFCYHNYCVRKLSTLHHKFLIKHLEFYLLPIQCQQESLIWVGWGERFYSMKTAQLWSSSAVEPHSCDSSIVCSIAVEHHGPERAWARQSGQGDLRVAVPVLQLSVSAAAQLRCCSSSQCCSPSQGNSLLWKLKMCSTKIQVKQAYIE